MTYLKFLKLAMAVFGLSAAASASQAALLAYEGFDYTPDISFVGKNGGTGFSSSWYPSGTDPRNSVALAGSLTYTDSFGNSLVTSGNRALVTGNGSASGDNIGGVFTNQDTRAYRDLTTARGSGTESTTTWISLLAVRTGTPLAYKDTAAGSTLYYGRGTGFDLFSDFSERLVVGRATQSNETDSTLPNDTWSVMNNGQGQFTVASLVPLTDMVFITLRIDHVTGSNSPGNDEAYLWLNHPNLALEPDTTDALHISPGLFGSTGTDYNFNQIRLFAGGTIANVGYGAMQFDEIRIGETFADVAPFTAVPEPSTLGLLGLFGVAALIRLYRRK